MEELILEIKQWNHDWDAYIGSGKTPPGITEFCNNLKKKYKVIKK